MLSLDCSDHLQTMRIVSWNIEWMNDWFAGGGKIAFRKNHYRTGIADVAALCRRVSLVVKHLNPDVLCIQEGPSDKQEMQIFADTYLKNSFHIFGGADGGAQKVYILTAKKRELANAKIADDTTALKLQKSWQADINGDYDLEDYKFTRRPLVVEVNINKRKIKIINLHTKSKYVHDGEKLWKDKKTRKEFIKKAVQARRRISSEAFRLRRYLDTLVEKDSNSLIVVCGDFNDGPGIDYFEKFYLMHNTTDILLGSTYYPNLLFQHAFLEKVAGKNLYTAVFDDFIDNIKGRKLLLDHVLVSPALKSFIKNAGIAHREYNKEIDQKASTRRQKHPSDHRPVFIDLF